MKQRSHSVQASTTGAKSALFTPSTSPLGEASTRSNNRGKLSQRLKQRRQPWQMSKTRRISASSFVGSAKSGSIQASGWRVGASRLPSVIAIFHGQERGLPLLPATEGGEERERRRWSDPNASYQSVR